MLAQNYVTNWRTCQAHILSCYPNEGGGVVDKKNKFHPLENLAENKKSAFEPAPVDFSDVRCVLHSHTYNPLETQFDDNRVPSIQDMKGQIDTDVEWAIVVCEGENVTPPFFWGDYDHRPPLMEREFIHSVQDCLCFMQDWQYKNSGLKLPMFPRKPDWFTSGEDHMMDQYKGWGFNKVADGDRKKGDVIFYRIQSSVVNHIGVVLDENTVAHHLYGRFPKVEPFTVWHKYIYQIIRHVTNDTPKGVA